MLVLVLILAWPDPPLLIGLVKGSSAERSLPAVPRLACVSAASLPPLPPPPRPLSVALTILYEDLGLRDLSNSSGWLSGDPCYNQWAGSSQLFPSLTVVPTSIPIAIPTATHSTRPRTPPRVPSRLLTAV